MRKYYIFDQYGHQLGVVAGTTKKQALVNAKKKWWQAALALSTKEVDRAMEEISCF